MRFGPPVRVTRNTRGTRLAYQVLGDGPPDLVFLFGWPTHSALSWENPAFAEFLHGLASFSRLILFDRAGTGMSDRGPTGNAFEDFMDDIRAVLGAVGSEQAAFFGCHLGGRLALLFAATHPQQTSAVVTFAAHPATLRDANYPWDRTRRSGRGSSTPSRATRSTSRTCWKRWHHRRRRSVDEALVEHLLAVGHQRRREHARDQRHRTGRHPRDPARRPRADPAAAPDRGSWRRRGRQQVHGRAAAVGRLRRAAGRRPLPVLRRPGHGPGEDSGVPHRGAPTTEPDRVVLAVLFTDIVGSTARASELGDRRWRRLLEAHDTVVPTNLARFRGREIETTGDGFLATFDGPARAIRAAVAMRDELAEAGVQIRGGLHTGEVELDGDHIRGIAVHIAARVLAGDGELLCSRTVRDLVAGSGFAFTPRGSHRLKGVPDEWALFGAELAAR